MTVIGWIQIFLYCAIVAALVKPLGWYMTRIFNGERTFLSPILRPVRADSFVASAALVACGFVGTASAQAQVQAPPNMTFFVTSAGPGKGADLGGLEGVDRHCQQLATAVGAGAKSWRAYLDTNSIPPNVAVNARDRIGKGPWQNFPGRGGGAERRRPAQRRCPGSARRRRSLSAAR